MFTVNILMIFLNVELSCNDKQITDIISMFVTSVEKVCKGLTTKFLRNCASGRNVLSFCVRYELVRSEMFI
jgi:hypothetical protein